MVNFEEAFAETGHGRFNHIVLVTCGLLLMYTNTESLGIGYIMAAAECDLELRPTEVGMVNAAVFLGIMITAIVWGYMSDHFGRRRVMLPAIMCAIVASFTSSFALNFWNLFVLRFVTGCCVSASSATVYAYLGEMHSSARRSEVIAFASTFISATFIAVPLLAWIIMAGTWSFSLGSMTIVPWRVFMWSWCLPGVISSSLLLMLPESPCYLFAMKGQEKTVPVLAKIYAWNTKKKKEDYPVKEIEVVRQAAANTTFGTAIKNMWVLMRPPLRRCVFISHFAMFMLFMMSSGLYTWMPIMLNETLYKINQPVSVCAIMLARKNENHVACKQKKTHHLLYPVAFAMGTFCAITYVTCGFIMRKFNKISIFCCLVISGSLILTVASVVPQPIVATILLVSGLCSGCASAVLAAIAVEVFPTSVRSLALCTLFMTGRLGAAIGANLLGALLHEHCMAILLSILLSTAATALLLLLWPDPKSVKVEMEDKGYSY